MVRTEKVNRKSLFLRNFNEDGLVLDFKSMTEFKVSNQEVVELTIIGNYAYQDDEIVIIYRMKSKTHLQIGERLIELNDVWGFNVKNIDKDNRVFTIVEGENLIYELVYSRQKFVGFDAWNDEDDIDIFAWMTNLQKEKRLLQVF